MSPRARSGGSADSRPRPLTSPQRTAAELLGRGKTQVEAAKAAGGVTPRTVRDWLRRPAFREAVEEARREAADADPTERVLREALSATTPDGGPDWPTRVRAARMLRLPPPGERHASGPTHAAVHLAIRRGEGWVEATVVETGETFRHEVAAAHVRPRPTEPQNGPGSEPLAGGVTG